MSMARGEAFANTVGLGSSSLRTGAVVCPVVSESLSQAAFKSGVCSPLWHSWRSRRCLRCSWCFDDSLEASREGRGGRRFAAGDLPLELDNDRSAESRRRLASGTEGRPGILCSFKMMRGRGRSSGYSST